jgi:hypothetical protein
MLLNKPYLYDGVYASGPNAGQPNTINVDAQIIMVILGSIAAEGFIYDTSWFRVRELSFSYRLDAKL